MFTKLLKFFSIGGFLLLITIMLYYLAFEVASLPLYPTYIGVFLLTVLFSYLLNSKFTFKKEISIVDGFKYYLTYGFGLVIGLVLLIAIKYYAESINDFYASTIVILPRTFLNYFIVNKFIFNKNISV